MAKPNPFKWILDATFASRPNATVVEPTPARKDAGWLRAQKIPAQAMNWALHSIQEQIDWLLGEAFLETQQIPAAAGQSDGTNKWNFLPSVAGGTASAWLAPGAGTAQLLAYPLIVPVGRRITAVRAYVFGHTGSALDLLVWKSTAAGGNTQVGTTQSSGLTSTAQTLAVTGLTETVAANVYYHAIVRANSGNNIAQKSYGVEVDFDRP